MAEWEQAIGFLTATGRACTDTRQEFVLLSDVLGVSMLVETINSAERDRPDEREDEGESEGGGATESTVLGPFHMTESPVRELGADIDLVGGGEPCVVSGRVLSTGRHPAARRGPRRLAGRRRGLLRRPAAGQMVQERRLRDHDADVGMTQQVVELTWLGEGVERHRDATGHRHAEHRRDPLGPPAREHTDPGTPAGAGGDERLGDTTSLVVELGVRPRLPVASGDVQDDRLPIAVPLRELVEERAEREWTDARAPIRSADR